MRPDPGPQTARDPDLQKTLDQPTADAAGEATHEAERRALEDARRQGHEAPGSITLIVPSRRA